VVAPCGWVDGWPAGVKAQGQISIAAHMALGALSEICESRGLGREAGHYRDAAATLAQRVHEVFYDPRTGLFAEHLFASGTVAGNQPSDFWTITQIWAALAGMAPDTRGLDACRTRGLSTGMRMIPESGIGASYMARFVDGVDELGLGSQATWALAAWPELTHLYALAELRYGRPDHALDAVRRQLPEQVHRRNPKAPPYYYPEKYIHPGTTPWLCTWAGDPTLLQVMLEGFGGIHVGLDGMRVRPQLPTSWRAGEAFRCRFCWRGSRWQLIVEREDSGGMALDIDGHRVPDDGLIRAEELPPRALYTVRAAPES
jgi:hypothetical protein